VIQEPVIAVQKPKRSFIMTVKLSVQIGCEESGGRPSTCVEESLSTAVLDSLPPQELADLVGMPKGTGISFELSNEDDAADQDNVVRVKLSVRVPDDSKGLIAPQLVANLGDLVFERLDGLHIPQLHGQPATGQTAKPREMRVIVVDEHPGLISSEDLAKKAGFEPGTALGWSKGCNSWPW
jgi:hypothetical protein